MHILLAILGGLAAAFFAFRYFVDAANEGREAVRDVRGAFRRGKWSRQIDKRLIENIDDPREAAAVLLYQTANYDGAVTEAQKAKMVAEMRETFSADEETAEGLYAFARMAVGEINDAANSLKKILRSVNEACTEEKKKSVLTMMTSVGQVEGALSDTQARLIEETRRILLAD